MTSFAVEKTTQSADDKTLVRDAPSSDGARIFELLQKLARPAPAVEQESVLGEGGMGIVHLATQVPLGRKVAVKRLSPGNATRQQVEALLAESWLSGSLEHPNIVPVHELGLDADGLPVLVMKRIEGQSWASLLRDEKASGTPRLESNLRILMQVCNALHYAHARGVVHRDVKPDNVMVGGFGEVYLCDWGIAVAPGPSTQLAGTPSYMAPEMLGGDGAVLSARTDVYLLGAVLFELLTGWPPHVITSADALTQGVLAPLPPFPADVPEELAELTRRCLHREPEQRPQSALAVRTALEHFLAHLGSLELTAQAERRLTELQALLGGAEPNARRVFDLFSECRFGFQQSLRGWAQNERARRGLDQAVTLMVRFQLASGSPHTAQSLLSELVTPDAALHAEVEAAVSRLNTERIRLVDLEKSLDPNTGSTSRLLIAIGASVPWVALPLLFRALVPTWEQHDMMFSAAMSGLSVPVLIIAALKSPAARTPLNANMLRILVFGMATQTIALLGYRFFVGDLGALTVPILELYWFSLAGTIASALLPGAWLTAAGYLTAALLAARFPEWRNHTMALGNAALGLNAVLLFRKPSSRTDPNRAIGT